MDSQDLPLRFGKIRFGPVQQQHGLLQQAFLRLRVPDHALPGKALDGCFGLCAGLLRTADHHRRRRAGFGLDLFHQLDGRNVGHPKIERDGIQVLLLHHSQGLPAGAHRDDLDIASAEGLLPVGPARFFRRDDQQLLGAPLQGMMNGVERDVQIVLGDRFFQIRHGAQGQPAAAVFIAGDHVHRYVARGRIVLQPVENRPAGHVGQGDVQRDGAGDELAGECQRRAAAQRDQGLDAALVRQVHQDAGEGDIVLDDQQHRIAGTESGCGRRRFRCRAPRRSAPRTAAAE